MLSRETHAVRRFDPSGCDFRAPIVGLWPRPSRATWRRICLTRTFVQREPSAGYLEHFSHARYAIDRVLSEIATNGRGRLVAPSYHCRTMLDAAVARGAQLALYPLTPSLAPNLHELAEILNASAGPTVVLVTHFFGFRAPISEVQALCKAVGAKLIEDCSHCFVDGSGLPLGRGGQAGTRDVRGDFVIASPYKMFPAQDGGTLWTNSPMSSGDASREPDPAEALRSWAVLARELLVAWPAEAPSSTQYDASPCGRDESGDDNGAPSQAFDPRMSRVRSLPASRWMVRHSRLDVIAKARRLRFEQWDRAVRGAVGLCPLYDTLGPDTVPYVFPLLINGASAAFFALKRWGVALGRWDDMLESSCDVAARYRTALVHLPCHQEITDEQMAWMIDCVLRAAVR